MDKIKYMMGLILAKLFPKKADELHNTFTIPDYWINHQSGHYVDRFIRFYLGYKAKKQERKNPGELEAIHKNFWEKVDTYFSIYESRTETSYLPTRILFKD